MPAGRCRRRWVGGGFYTQLACRSNSQAEGGSIPGPGYKQCYSSTASQRKKNQEKSKPASSSGPLTWTCPVWSTITAKRPEKPPCLALARQAWWGRTARVTTDVRGSTCPLSKPGVLCQAAPSISSCQWLGGGKLTIGLSACNAWVDHCAGSPYKHQEQPAQRAALAVARIPCHSAAARWRGLWEVPVRGNLGRLGHAMCACHAWIVLQHTCARTGEAPGVARSARGAGCRQGTSSQCCCRGERVGGGVGDGAAQGTMPWDLWVLCTMQACCMAACEQAACRSRLLET